MSNRLEILPVSATKYPLVAWGNNGGRENECFAILPRRNVAAYFSRNIQSHLNEKNNIKGTLEICIFNWEKHDHEEMVVCEKKLLTHF